VYQVTAIDGNCGRTCCTSYADDGDWISTTARDAAFVRHTRLYSNGVQSKLDCEGRLYVLDFERVHGDRQLARCLVARWERRVLFALPRLQVQSRLLGDCDVAHVDADQELRRRIRRSVASAASAAGDAGAGGSTTTVAPSMALRTRARRTWRLPTSRRMRPPYLRRGTGDSGSRASPKKPCRLTTNSADIRARQLLMTTSSCSSPVVSGPVRNASEFPVSSRASQHTSDGSARSCFVAEQAGTSPSHATNQCSQDGGDPRDESLFSSLLPVGTGEVIGAVTEERGGVVSDRLDRLAASI